MRLIDIDKVVSDYKGKNKSLQNVTWFELTDYEVKAIPIEWLINYEIKNGQETRLQEAITQWEKENEAN